MIGVLPLLLLTFFSLGLRSEGAWGFAAFALGVVSLICLAGASTQNKRYWILALIQALLLTGVVIESVSDSILYIGT
jgi:hypothetical protein